MINDRYDKNSKEILRVPRNPLLRNADTSSKISDNDHQVVETLS